MCRNGIGEFFERTRWAIFGIAGAGLAAAIVLAIFGSGDIGAFLVWPALLTILVLSLALVWALGQLRALHEQLQFHKDAERLAKLGHWWWDVETGEVTWSDQVYRIFKLNSATFKPEINAILDLSPWPEENARGRELIERAIESKEPGTYEQRFLYPDGTTGYYISTFHGVYDKNGKLVGMQGVVQDSTEQKNVEIDLSLVNSAIENSLNAFDIVDEQGTFIYVNKAYVKMWGYESSDEIVGTTPAGHCADPDMPKYIIETLTRDGQCVTEFTARRKDGSYFDVLMYARKDMDRHGQTIYPSTAIDITKRKRAEAELNVYRESLEELVKARTQELERTQVELISKERVATLGQLSATVSHELRNPLGTIQASLFLIRNRTEGHDLSIDGPLVRAERNIERCVRIIEELQDYTRNRELSRTAIDMNAWLEEIRENFTVPENVSIEYDIQSPVTLYVDQEKFGRCVQNVWKNACDALWDDGGNFVGAGHPELSLNSRVENARFELIVRDNGCGIKMEDRDKVREPLFTTKGFGVGLGLSIATDVMSAHYGGLEIDSESGVGTKVTIWLPINVEDETGAMAGS